VSFFFFFVFVQKKTRFWRFCACRKQDQKLSVPYFFLCVAVQQQQQKKKKKKKKKKNGFGVFVLGSKLKN
jgi:hypothetical protein